MAMGRGRVEDAQECRVLEQGLHGKRPPWPPWQGVDLKDDLLQASRLPLEVGEATGR